MSKIRDLTNQQFGRLTAKEMIGSSPGKGAIWRYECSCGGYNDVPAIGLINIPKHLVTEERKEISDAIKGAVDG